MTQNASESLYLIDGSGFIFRAFHALPMMTRADGTPVNAVYGFCNMLQKLLTELKAHHIAVIFDKSRKTFRNDIFPEYKAHRPPPPEELVPQFALIREATIAFGLPSIEIDGFEADDLIAAYAKESVKHGRSVRIVSADKDLMQLIRDGVELFDPMKAIPIGAAEVEAKFGVPPDKVTDVQALAGDSTDGVPGAPGIGVKTAAQLILEYGDLETLLARAGEIKQPKRREILTSHADIIRISKRLVTLDDNTPLPLPLSDLTIRENHREDLLAFLEAQGFRSLLARFQNPNTAPTLSSPRHSGASRSEEPGILTEPTSNQSKIPGSPAGPRNDGNNTPDTLLNAPLHYECVQDLATLQKWIAAARAKGHVAIDTETTSLTPSTTQMVGFSLAIEPGRACYVPVAHIDPNAAPEDGFAFTPAEAPKQIPLKDCVAALKPLFEDAATLKIAHNLKFDMQVFGQHGLVPVSFDDTMLLSYVLGAGAHGHGLDELALRHFQHKMISYDDVTGTGKSKVTFERVPLDKATPYAAEDADFTLRLWLLLKPMVATHHVLHVYERMERPLIPVIAAMERAGILIDPAVLKMQSDALTKRLMALEEEIHALAGHPFNIASPKQMGEVLFGEMNLPGGARGKTGAFGTSHDVLEPLAEAGHEIVIKILDWRGIAKLKSTYTDALPEQIDKKTGRVHTSYSMVGAATGRLSSTDPNLQNIPIRTEDGRAIRRAFIAKEGSALLSVDYSQIELRLAAEAANIHALQQAFADGIDIHALTASQVFNIPLAELPPEKRRQAKAINFGIIYGISGFGLAKQLGCDPGEATAFIRAYLDKFHELRDWMEDTKNFARSHGYVETLFGRRIHIAGIGEKNPMRRMGAERQAINAPLQGTAADIMKRAMIQMPAALEAAGLTSQLLLQVHDELVFETPLNEMEKTIPLVKKIMENAPLPALTLKVPLVAEAGYAANWAQAH